MSKIELIDIDNKFETILKEKLSNLGENLLLNMTNPNWKKPLGNNKHKTYADMEMHTQIHFFLKNYFPNIPIFSEEIIHKISDRKACYWLVDPLDGTASWLEGFKGFVIQVCLINNKKVIYGMIYSPYMKKFWSGHGKNGCLINDEKFDLKKIQSEEIRIIDNYPKPEGIILKITEKLKKYKYIECGSIGLKTILTLSGDADLFVKDTVFRDWDIAPAIPFAEASGGYIYDLSFNPLKIGDKIVFKNGLIVSHDLKIINILKNLFRRNYEQLVR